MLKYKIVSVILLFWPGIIVAEIYPVYKNSSTIAVLDQEYLFTESIWGKEILKRVEMDVADLSAENRSIEKLLEEEELLLTEKRKIIKKIEFDKLSLAFDSKVKKIRTDQANKQRDINFFLNEKRKLFFEKITPILLSFIDELGIEVLLNKDTVALASTGSDITMVAIARINSHLK